MKKRILSKAERLRRKQRNEIIKIFTAALSVVGLLLVIEVLAR